MTAKQTKGDGPVWNDDTVGVIIDPDDRPNGLHHLIIKSAGELARTEIERDGEQVVRHR